MTNASTANSREPVDTRTWLSAAAQGDEALVRALLAAGADVNAASEDGETALVRAASKGHLHIVQLLLEAGADPNARREDGFNALGVAVFFGYTGVVRALLARGADPSANGRLAANAEKWALVSGYDEIAEMLKEPDSAGARRPSAEAASGAAASAGKSEGPEFFPAEGTFNSVVPLSTIYESSAAPETSSTAGGRIENVEHEIVADEVAEPEPEEQEVTTLIRARKSPATLAPFPTHAYNPRRERQRWPRKAALLAVLVVAGLSAGAFTGLVAGGYWKRSENPAETQRPAPPAADAAPLGANAAPANETAPPTSDGQQTAGATTPETQTSQPTATQLSETGVAPEPKSVDDARSRTAAAETDSRVESDKRERPAAQPAPAVKTSEAARAPRAEPVSRREASTEARAGRTTSHAIGEKTGGGRRAAEAPPRPRRTETRAATPSPRDNPPPVFSPKPSGNPERKVIPWP